MENLYSYHIFLLPFKWTRKHTEDLSFSEQTDISQISVKATSSWQRVQKPLTDQYKREFFNEKNFFYKFVHPAIYDEGDKSNNILQHFERKEMDLQNVEYIINVKADKPSTYVLRLKSLTLDLYNTGVGILSFFIENNTYSDFEDVLRINQFGRRIYPPFVGQSGTAEDAKNFELADYLQIKGLTGAEDRYFEDFASFGLDDFWKPSKIIANLINDCSKDIEFELVIDDRMFVQCWYGNDELSKKIKYAKNEFLHGDNWYRYLFIDNKYATCQNDEMKIGLLNKNTYSRWQKEGSLIGCSRYSLVYITDTGFGKNILLPYFRTQYCRLSQLCLLQRASVLSFDDKIAKLSVLKETNLAKLSSAISSFYQQYLRFVNRFFFREVTAQEQGIEVYKLLFENMRIEEQVEDLDGEIQELHNYVSLLEEKERNRQLSVLTILGGLFVVPSFIIGFIGLNSTNSFVSKNKLLFLVYIFIASIFLFFLTAKKGDLFTRNTLAGISYKKWLGIIALTAIVYFITCYFSVPSK